MNYKEKLLPLTFESEMDENIKKNENKFTRISMQLQNLRLLEKATIILIAIPYTLTYGSLLIIFPYLFVFYISEKDANHLFALLLILIYNIAHLLGSIILPFPCFGDKLGLSFALNGLLILFFLFSVLMNILYFNTMELPIEDFANVLYIFLPTIGSFLAGFSAYSINQLHYIYLMHCLNSYNKEQVLTLFYKIFSFGMLINAIFSLFFHVYFILILCIGQIISIFMFLFLKKPDLVFKEYITNLYKDYNLNDLIVKRSLFNEINEIKADSLEIMPRDSNNYNEEDDLAIIPTNNNNKPVRQHSSMRDLQSHILKKDMRILTALSCLEALISSYLVLIIPSTLLKIKSDSLLAIDKNEIFYQFSLCFIIIGISQCSTLFIKKFNFKEEPNYSCNELLKAFSFLIVVYVIGYFFESYYVILAASAFLGYCYFLTILVIENQIFMDFEQMNLNISMMNMTNCLVKAGVFVVGLVLIDTNPFNSLIIYVALIFFIWRMVKKK